jgi:hypothetical protein
VPKGLTESPDFINGWREPGGRRGALGSVSGGPVTEIVDRCQDIVTLVAIGWPISWHSPNLAKSQEVLAMFAPNHYV